MENNTDSDSVVLFSGPHTGLKRDFSMILKVQSEMNDSLGWNRATMFQSSPSSNGDSRNSSNKRLKSSVAEEELKNKYDPLNESVKSSSLEESKNHVDVANPTSGEDPMSYSLKSPTAEKPKTDWTKSPIGGNPVNNAAKSTKEERTDTEISNAVNDDMVAQNALLEKSQSLFTHSALKPETEPMEISEAAMSSGSSAVLEDVCKNETTETNNGKYPASRSCRDGTNARLSKRSLTPKSFDSSSGNVSLQNKRSQGKITRKHLKLHKLVFEEDGLPDGTELAYYCRGKKLLEGYKKGFAIFCHCCKDKVSPSVFEAHAGCASRRKPYLNIYTSNGVSLHELSVSLSRERKLSVYDNDDLCSICADFGDLLLCDGCPRAFHRDCLQLSSIPNGKWYCPYCLNMYNREKSCGYNANAKAAGRVSGVDSIEQISKRCIRIVKTQETEAGGCVLCRHDDFTKSGFGSRTVILCDQCEKGFHVGCLKDHEMADLKELPKGKWFCCADCSKVHIVLQKLLVCGSEKLPDSLSNVIKKKHEDIFSNTEADLDIRWSLLSGKVNSPESRLLLSKAAAIFHDCFDPIIDPKTNHNLIPSMIYGRNTRDEEFGGMYCTVLTVNSSVVSAGVIRIFGLEVAELPIVATCSDNQGKGYFQSLLSCIERLLGFLNVRNIVLPAAYEAESIWTDKFGFNKITQDQLIEYRKNYPLMTFQGTNMLWKPVPKCRIVNKSTNSS